MQSLIRRQKEMIKAAVGSAGQITLKVATANPLIAGEEKVVPNITKPFRRGQNSPGPTWWCSSALVAQRSGREGSCCIRSASACRRARLRSEPRP